MTSEVRERGAKVAEHKPPFPEQQQEHPGDEAMMQPRADHGEKTYKGSGKLKGMATLISGAHGEGTWSVRYRPQGMSGGITLWGRPSAFTLPDGTPLKSLRAEN